jgi:hypothetical protein
MKLKIFLSIISLFSITSLANSNEMGCDQFDKLSAKFLECKANELKEKTSQKVKNSKEKFESSSIKDKLKKFKSSKTLTDLINN